jgi:hypothetical protein
MTNLQVVKALDAQIEASFKRSASDPVEIALRADIRRIQGLYRQAHKSNVIHKRVVQATADLMRVVTPDMAKEIADILARY